MKVGFLPSPCLLDPFLFKQWSISLPQQRTEGVWWHFLTRQPLGINTRVSWEIPLLLHSPRIDGNSSIWVTTAIASVYHGSELYRPSTCMKLNWWQTGNSHSQEQCHAILVSWEVDVDWRENLRLVSRNSVICRQQRGILNMLNCTARGSSRISIFLIFWCLLDTWTDLYL